jgi:orotate phosphoribosyltransferase
MQDKLIQLLAGRRGHFQMESGYHSERWFNLDVLFTQPTRLAPFVAELGRRLAAHRIDAVCGPLSGGAKLARDLAPAIGAEFFYSERFEQPGATGLFPVKYFVPQARRAALAGKRVAIVDDAISAGSAVRGTHADLLRCGAKPVVLGALFVFGDRAARFATENDLGLEAIAPMSFGMWLPGECPLCKAGVPVETVSDASPTW